MAVRKALHFLTGADVGTKLKWAKRAEAMGIELPKAASAVENLARWIPEIAEALVAEERIR